LSLKTAGRQTYKRHHFLGTASYIEEGREKTERKRRKKGRRRKQIRI
jgi:hypothetical protein